MPETISQGVNNGAPATSPAGDETLTGSFFARPAEDDFSGLLADDAPSGEALGRETGASVDEGDKGDTAEGQPPSEGQDAPATDKTATADPGKQDPAEATEQRIPKPRFDEVNQRAKEFERQLQERTEENEALRLGIPDVAQYRSIKAQASASGYPDAGSFIAAVQEARQAQERMEGIKNDYALDETTRQQMLTLEQRNLEMAQQMHLLRAQSARTEAAAQQITHRLHAEAITAARQAAEVEKFPDEIEQILQVASPEQVDLLTAGLKTMLAARDNTTRARYASSKGETARVPSPEGAGKPPPTEGDGGPQGYVRQGFSRVLNIIRG